MRLNPAAPDYYPSPYIRTYTCYLPVPPRGIPVPFPPPFPSKPAPATPPCPFNPKLRWVPKDTLRNQTRFHTVAPVASSLPATKPLDLEFRTSGTEIEGRTTIMIKNIPTKLTREMLILLLDQHCAEQEKDVESEFDFVYLPIDFRTGLSRGYAFVNFTSPKAAEKSHEKMHHRKWSVFRSQKIAHICYARIQGKEALVNRFKCTQFRCNTDEFLPVIFTPPRNGTTSLPSPDVIGRRPKFF